MITHIRFAFASTVVALLAWLALVVPAKNLAMAYEGKTVTVTEKDNGSKVSIGQGDTLVVRLDANAGTLFNWKLVKNNNTVLSLQSQSTERTGKPVPGGKVTRVWHFKGEAVGTSELEMHYGPPSDTDKPPERTLKLSIKVE